MTVFRVNTFVDTQLHYCRKHCYGKLNIDKYSGESGEALAEKLSIHDECDYVQKLIQHISNTEHQAVGEAPRNYIMTSLMICNFQRPGAIYNMKLTEFQQAIYIKESNRYCILIFGHKTCQQHGPAKIHLSSEMYQLMNNYLRFWRPVCKNTNFFVSAQGNNITNSCCWLIFSRHLKNCDIGVEYFNANMWRRASSSKIQGTWDNELMEAGGRQFTHSRQQQQMSYQNATTVMKSSENHSRLTSAVFNDRRSRPPVSNKISAKPRTVSTSQDEVSTLLEEPVEDVCNSRPKRHCSTNQVDYTIDEEPFDDSDNDTSYQPPDNNEDYETFLYAKMPTKMGGKRYFRHSDRLVMKEYFDNLLEKTLDYRKLTTKKL